MTASATLDRTSVLFSIVKNAASQTGGRMLLALLRFAIAALIVRQAGLDTFGHYALILGLLLAAEWVTDFGQTDIFVRDAARSPERRRQLLRASAGIRVLQSLAASCGLVALLFWFGFPQEVRDTALVAALVPPLHAGTLILRGLFRIDMRLERDVGAELLGTLALLSTLLLFVTADTTPLELVSCHVGARALQLLLARVWHDFDADAPAQAPARGTSRHLLAAAMPLGLAGLLTAAYDAMDAVALSLWASADDVGAFSAAMRFLILAVLIVQSLTIAVFPVLSARWLDDRAGFVRVAQGTLDAAALLGAMIFVGLNVGATGLASLLGDGRDAMAIGATLQLLSWAVLARILVTVMAPLVVVAQKQLHVVWVTAVVVISKAVGLTLLVPGAGAEGAVRAYLISEIVVGLLPAILICQYVTRTRFSWRVPIGSVLLASAVVAAAALTGLSGPLFSGVAAALLFAAFALLLGLVRVAQLRDLASSVSGRFGRSDADT